MALFIKNKEGRYVYNDDIWVKIMSQDTKQYTNQYIPLIIFKIIILFLNDTILYNVYDSKGIKMNDKKIEYFSINQTSYYYINNINNTIFVSGLNNKGQIGLGLNRDEYEPIKWYKHDDWFYN